MNWKIEPNRVVMLYTMKFVPRLKERIWGGDLLVKTGKKATYKQDPDMIGESWEISGVEGDVSVVSNGFLKGNNLQELVEVYMGELVGEAVFDRYGFEFPVLVKFIDAHQTLSVQVHPDDELAGVRHGARGKTEMWYVVDCKPGAVLYIGFKRPVSRDEYLAAVAEGRLLDLLARYEARKGDSYYIPAGTVHAIGEGVVVAEIQETSNITYRIDDWGRVDGSGNPRQLHTVLATDAIDFNPDFKADISRRPHQNIVEPLVSCGYFTTNLLKVNGCVERDFAPLDSFVIYVCVEGGITVSCEGVEESLTAMHTLMVPAEQTDVTLKGDGTVLEVYLKED